MKPIDRLVLGSILIGLIVNLGSTFLSNSYPQANLYAVLSIAAAITIWGFYRFASTLLQYLRFGRYAVEVIFLNNNNELLLIRHPFHKCLLPPSGRLKQWQLPHEAVASVLENEAGITEFEFHLIFHNSSFMISDIVEDVPRPYCVQMEHRRQRGFIKFHYDFFYVCRSKGEDKPLIDVEGYHPRWMSLDEITKLGKGLRPFDDLIYRYKAILETLAASGAPEMKKTSRKRR